MSKDSIVDIVVAVGGLVISLIAVAIKESKN